MSSSLLDLIRSGAIPVGAELFHVPRSRPETGVTARITREGIKVGNRVFASPSTAAESITGKPTNGWMFWRLRASRQPLSSIRSGGDGA